ncbi:hypothetical protein [Psychroflexus sp. MES1-P1E]|uniref:hypothetical protein n=1 Tax=Psychroflexus sp. MES1-P1E TaxID=2058320 RepID=UPI000C7C8CA7|nr:hypothetical protein [Psychroflexus sp. MES1-P1E]PKG44287.1 hypothetical protein CXF67_00525 [Psychroflexus sp. MES1-P1E]
MTLQEAKIADKFLKNIYEAPVTDNSYLLKSEIYKALDFIKFENNEVSNHTKKDEYLALLVSDGYLIKHDHVAFCKKYKLTDDGKTFLLYKGGYTQMVEERIENKKREKNKYRFDIGKDIVLILLAIGTLLISYCTS